MVVGEPEAWEGPASVPLRIALPGRMQNLQAIWAFGQVSLGIGKVVRDKERGAKVKISPVRSRE